LNTENQLGSFREEPMFCEESSSLFNNRAPDKISQSRSIENEFERESKMNIKRSPPFYTYFHTSKYCFVDSFITLFLSVSDAPLVVLSLGSTLNPNDIKEGDDVYFECNIKANPKEHRITWYHDVSTPFLFE
jgi:hypothetical protein